MYSDGTCGRVQGKHENAAFGRIEFVDGTAISLGSYRYCRISLQPSARDRGLRIGHAAIIGGKGISRQNSRKVWAAPKALVEASVR